MVSVKLAKPWLEHAIGDTVEVDPLRAEWLRENGYETLLMTSDSASELPAGVPPSLDPDMISPGHTVSPRILKARLPHTPISDLAPPSPVVDLPTPNQDDPLIED